MLTDLPNFEMGRKEPWLYIFRMGMSSVALDKSCDFPPICEEDAGKLTITTITIYIFGRRVNIDSYNNIVFRQNNEGKERDLWNKMSLGLFKKSKFPRYALPPRVPIQSTWLNKFPDFFVGGFSSGLFILFRLPGTRTGRVVWDNLFVYWKPFRKLCSDVAIKDAILKRRKISSRLIPMC